MKIYDTESWSVFQYGAFSLGLPVEVVEFIYTHCRCVRCGTAIARDLSRCKCDESGRRGSHLEVECHGEHARDLFVAMVRREELRMMNRRRRYQVSRNGGSFTKNDIAELFEIQEGVCYFCGEQISMGKGKNNLHADHYDPIANGGRNDVFNLVLTCPYCNIAKGATHGDHFECVAKKTRDPNIGRRLGRIRRKLNRYRADRRTTA